MRRLSLVATVLALAVVALPCSAQENFVEGTVSRIILLKVTPGMNSEFWADIRSNIKPTYEEYKKQGIITDYSFFTKTSLEGPDDWSVGIRLTYKNFAGLDGLVAKMDPVTLKHYGGKDSRASAAKKRALNGTTVKTYLIREVDPKPMSNP
ncbi:MAG: hypothetical protein JJE51_06690 [Thermoanaerobaculia bacterium]|nr:hypothetical protein [Thermoanaerobaculia bacterium]